MRKAFKGERHVSDKVTGGLLLRALGRPDRGTLAAFSPVELLSDRELEVFERIGRGGDTKSIANALGVSPKTVETHRMHIKDKLQIKTMSELIQYAAVWVDRKTSGE